MPTIEIKAEIRQEKKSANARRLRRNKKVPAQYYGKGIENIHLSLSSESFNAFLRKNPINTLINLKIDGSDEIKQVIIKKIDRDPIKGTIYHVDFLHIDANKPIQLPIPVSFEGEPVGVKRDGGVLTIIMRNLNIECLPGEIPSSIKLDISALELGHSYHVSDVKSKGIKILNDKDLTLVSIHVSREAISSGPEKEEKSEEEDKEAAESAEADSDKKASGETAKDSKDNKDKKEEKK